MAGLEKFVAFRVSEEILQAVRLAALAEHTSVSALVRDAVVQRTAEVSARACRGDHREPEPCA